MGFGDEAGQIERNCEDLANYFKTHLDEGSPGSFQKYKLPYSPPTVPRHFAEFASTISLLKDGIMERLACNGEQQHGGMDRMACSP